MNRLKRVKVAGFKSIREMELELGRVNVLIGANGAGKSNLISFFKMLNFAIQGRLQEYVARQGGANCLLHYGAKPTPRIRGELDLRTERGTNTYEFEFVYVGGDTLVCAGETVSFLPKEAACRRARDIEPPGVGIKGTGLIEAARGGDGLAEAWLSAIRGWRAFQFHDTSETARIRLTGYINDNHSLNHDAGNLAAYLHMLRETREDYYQRIVSTIRLIAPFFGDFVLRPTELNDKSILLEWRERDNDMLFGPHQLSDGTLRMMALVTLLLQPEDRLPSLVIIDEPELGLHPCAIDVLSSLLRSLPPHVQVIAATQSVSMVDRCEPEDIVVVDRQEGESSFTRLPPKGLQEWLKEYSLSELWEKGVIEGRPSR